MCEIDTKTRLTTYHQLLKTDPDKAREFFERESLNDARFKSLVELRQDFLGGFQDFLDLNRLKF